MKVTIVSGKDGARRDTVEVPDNATVEDLKKLYRPALSEHRKAFKIPNPNPPAEKPAKDGEPAKKPRSSMITLDSKSTLAAQGVKNGAEVSFKDLGPQVGYRFVFIVEYAGPLAFLLLYASRPSFIYGSSAATEYGASQRLLIALFGAHFVKRELETMFVHKFSHPTMPLRNIFKNSIYYWSFAAFIGYVLCSPLYTAPSEGQVKAGGAAMVLFELLNFAVHLQLSLMRKGDGDQSRNVPKGPLFSLVSCPNYLFEVMSWVSFSFASNILSSWFFTLAGFLQMAEWAVKKHKGYIKTDAKNKKKKAIIPFLI